MTEHDVAIPIIHFDVAKGLDCELPPTAAVIYFWFEDWPIGHLWLETAHGLTNLRDAVACGVVADALDRARSALQAPPGDHASPLSTSIVICTRDRPGELRRCLAALPQQTRRADQVLVVDNSPKNEAACWIACEAGVDYIREDRAGLNFARNAGARAATGEIILYTDDDIVLHPRWLERMAAAFDAHIACVTGLVLPAELETDSQRHFERLWGFGRGYRRMDFGKAFFAADRTHGCPSWEIGAGASMAFRRAMFKEVGFFDERLDVGAAGCSGDSEYWHRILGAGWTCRYEPSAVAFHYHRRDAADLARQIRAYMRGHSAALLVQFERSGNVGNLRRALIDMPWWYARRVVRCLAEGPTENDRLLRQEIAGYMAGILFYLRTRRL